MMQVFERYIVVGVSEKYEWERAFGMASYTVNPRKESVE